MIIYISKKPDKTGGGSNTFAWNFARWAKKNGHKIVSDIRATERAIVIANLAEVKELEAARAAGCYIIHRIDEFFEKEEDDYRKAKHQKIFVLNKYANITVFQSEFVCRNAYPFIRPERYAIIANGADPSAFQPPSRPGRFIGHVTWSVDGRKRLDLLFKKIQETPQERFLLVGRHKKSEFDFRLPNVVLRGIKNRRQIAKEYKKMKLLFFPSENEPCPNIPIEAILAGVPVCYDNSGGTPEIVRECGEPLGQFDRLLMDLEHYRERCLNRQDLHFDSVARAYMAV